MIMIFIVMIRSSCNHNHFSSLIDDFEYFHLVGTPDYIFIQKGGWITLDYIKLHWDFDKLFSVVTPDYILHSHLTFYVYIWFSWDAWLHCPWGLPPDWLWQEMWLVSIVIIIVIIIITVIIIILISIIIGTIFNSVMILDHSCHCIHRHNWHHL